MRTATLRRVSTSDQGTLGELSSPEGLLLWVIELPWRDNALGKSCIPPGVYPCRWHNSPRFGWVYKLFGTEPRTEILIHVGNWAGDESLKFRSNSNGCLLPGVGRAKLDEQLAVTMSRSAVARIADHFARAPFTLTILPITPGAMP